MNTLLQSIGHALYGTQWQSDLARDLGVADRSVRRWLAGTYPVPDGAMAEMRALCVKRSSELAALAKTLKPPT